MPKFTPISSKLIFNNSKESFLFSFCYVVWLKFLSREKKCVYFNETLPFQLITCEDFCTDQIWTKQKKTIIANMISKSMWNNNKSGEMCKSDEKQTIYENIFIWWIRSKKKGDEKINTFFKNWMKLTHTKTSK